MGQQLSDKKPWQQGGEDSGGAPGQHTTKNRKAAILTMAGIIGFLAILVTISALGYHGSGSTTPITNKQKFVSDKADYTFTVDKTYQIKKPAPGSPTAGHVQSAVQVNQNIYIHEYQIGNSITLSKTNFKQTYYQIIGQIPSYDKLAIDVPVLVQIGANKDAAIQGKIDDLTINLTNNTWFVFKDNHEVQINCLHQVDPACQEVVTSFAWN